MMLDGSLSVDAAGASQRVNIALVVPKRDVATQEFVSNMLRVAEAWLDNGQRNLAPVPFLTKNTLMVHCFTMPKKFFFKIIVVDDDDDAETGNKNDNKEKLDPISAEPLPTPNGWTFVFVFPTVSDKCLKKTKVGTPLHALVNTGRVVRLTDEVVGAAASGASDGNDDDNVFVVMGQQQAPAAATKSRSRAAPHSLLARTTTVKSHRIFESPTAAGHHIWSILNTAVVTRGRIPTGIRGKVARPPDRVSITGQAPGKKKAFLTTAETVGEKRRVLGNTVEGDGSVIADDGAPRSGGDDDDDDDDEGGGEAAPEDDSESKCVIN